ncbi:hypothetical protein AM501_05390 [Aneurinibacillus migulanus]|uniref:hypothetical protein n=1 Tax=Aneurinibacillus migulanus TaxID=47500 RepID=UPI0005BA09CF|nr:hypothetical protein [Aneurinibacillus migulanus]KIV58559.1 hypothetical protein TS64_04225 [Aneurinibacillus migulanus]KPD09269.1 hypothetical protein AM501_05390 [Aneurinibacillus migulanus]
MIETLCIYYDDELSLSSGIYVSNIDNLDKNQHLEALVNDYYEFLNATISLYEEVEEFIGCIDKNRIIVFIKMLD